MAYSREDLVVMSGGELRDILREMGLAIHGTKPELVSRILRGDKRSSMRPSETEMVEYQYRGKGGEDSALTPFLYGAAAAAGAYAAYRGYKWHQANVMPVYERIQNERYRQLGLPESMNNLDVNDPVQSDNVRPFTTFGGYNPGFAYNIRGQVRIPSQAISYGQAWNQVLWGTSPSNPANQAGSQ